MEKTSYLLSILFLLITLSSNLPAQQLHRVQGEILVQLAPDVNPQLWAAKFEQLNGVPTKFLFNKLLSAPMRAYSFTFDYTVINEYRMLDAIRRNPAVNMAQFNHLIQMRLIPNDPEFPNQWQYINTGQSGGLPGADLDMEQAWDITTGGITVDSDTIVVCAIDSGLDLDHEDFEDNHWLNHAEIPDNGIDDDNNGYIDDYRGWNIISNTDNVNDNNGHGTAVAGIIGAKGNNGIGVAGVNWNVKVMVVKNNFNTNEARVLEAYTYPLIMRMRYNASGGSEGAFVVATNSSWGTDFGNPAEAPLWCAFYDTLGVHGIISCGATINSNVNVDEEGDLPTGCTSDYLISVTNVNDEDEKVMGAGYGAVSIDLGAFGAGTWTTDAGNDYDDFGGTSGATPHVAGTIGLLYSAPCPSIMALAKSDPGAAALLMKQFVLDGVDPNESLDTITLTGGRLNINNSLQLLLANCGDCLPPSSLRAIQITDASARLSWNVNDSINAVDLRWRAVGENVWVEISNATSPYPLNNLLACTNYEFQLKPYCNSETLDFGNSQVFMTDGCCELPASIQLETDTIFAGEAFLIWNSVLAADSYNVRIKEPDSTEWTIINTSDTSFIFSNLHPCTYYETQVQTLCGGMAMTGYSPSQIVFTFGCGPCVEADYCVPVNINGVEEWIGSIEIGPISNISGSDGGYGNYTLLPPAIFEVDSTYTLALDPDFIGFSFTQDFHIWVDLNQDASFSPNELLFESPNPSGNVQMGEITIPATALSGNTRLRVVMQHQNVEASCVFNSGTFGEVEDYCINIVSELDCNGPQNLDTLSVSSTEVELGWTPVSAALSYIVRYKKTTDGQWTALTITGNTFLLTGLEKCEEYEAQIRTICANSQGLYSPSLVFNTDCVSSIEEELDGVTNIQVYPNPFHSELIIELELAEEASEIKIQLINTLGHILQEKAILMNIQKQVQLGLNGQGLSPGLYFIRIKNEKNQAFTQKVLKL